MNTDNQANAAGMVGGEIRKLRKIKRLTLKELGEMTDLSVGYLSQVERNLSSPTVKALFDISHALGVNIHWFFNGDDGARQGEARYITRGDKRRSIRYDSGIVDQKLNTAAVANLEFLYSTFAAQATSAGEPYSHDGEECGLVVSGSLQITIDGVSYQLEKGDSFSFPSNLEHSYANPAAEAAEVIWCISPPTY